MIKKCISVLDLFDAHIADGIQPVWYSLFSSEAMAFSFYSLDNEKDDLQKPQKFKVVLQFLSVFLCLV